MFCIKRRKPTTQLSDLTKSVPVLQETPWIQSGQGQCYSCFIAVWYILNTHHSVVELLSSSNKGCRCIGCQTRSLYRPHTLDSLIQTPQKRSQSCLYHSCWSYHKPQCTVLNRCRFPSFRSWNWTWKRDGDGCKMGSFPSHRWRHCLQSHSELLDFSAVPLLQAKSWASIRHFISFQTSCAGNGLNNCFVVM